MVKCNEHDYYNPKCSTCRAAVEMEVERRKLVAEREKLERERALLEATKTEEPGETPEQEDYDYREQAKVYKKQLEECKLQLLKQEQLTSEYENQVTILSIGEDDDEPECKQEWEVERSMYLQEIAQYKDRLQKKQQLLLTEQKEFDKLVEKWNEVTEQHQSEITSYESKLQQFSIELEAKDLQIKRLEQGGGGTGADDTNPADDDASCGTRQYETLQFQAEIKEKDIEIFELQEEVKALEHDLEKRRNDNVQWIEATKQHQKEVTSYENKLQELSVELEQKDLQIQQQQDDYDTIKIQLEQRDEDNNDGVSIGATSCGTNQFELLSYQSELKEKELVVMELQEQMTILENTIIDQSEETNGIGDLVKEKNRLQGRVVELEKLVNNYRQQGQRKKNDTVIDKKQVKPKVKLDNILEEVKEPLVSTKTKKDVVQRGKEIINQYNDLVLKLQNELKQSNDEVAHLKKQLTTSVDMNRMKVSFGDNTKKQLSQDPDCSDEATAATALMESFSTGLTLLSKDDEKQPQQQQQQNNMSPKHEKLLSKPYNQYGVDCDESDYDSCSCSNESYDSPIPADIDREVDEYWEQLMSLQVNSEALFSSNNENATSILQGCA